MTPEMLAEIRARASKPCLERDSFGQTCGNEITCGPCVDRRRAAPSDVAALLEEVGRLRGLYTDVRAADVATVVRERDEARALLAQTQADARASGDALDEARAEVERLNRELDAAADHVLAVTERRRAEVLAEREACAALVEAERVTTRDYGGMTANAYLDSAAEKIRGRPAP